MASIHPKKTHDDLPPAGQSFLLQMRREWLPLLHFLPLLMIIAFVLFMPSPRLGTGMTKMQLQAMGDMNKRIIFSLAFLLAGFALLRCRGATKQFVNENKMLVLLVIYTGLTVLWASSPAVAFKRWAQFAGFLLVIWCALLPADSPKKILTLLRFLFATALLASILAAFIRPAMTIEPATGAWRGIFSHKNILGQVTVLAMILWLPALSEAKSAKTRFYTLIILTTAFMLLLKSNSKTALVIFLIIFSWWAVFKFPLRREIKILLLPIPVLLILFWMLNFQNASLDEMVFSTLQRDTSFTGRTILWKAFTENIGAQTVFGSGYNSFWISSNDIAGHLIQQLGWDPGQAHNGYLDILNELGVAGALIFLFFIIKSTRQSWRLMLRETELGVVCFFMMLAQILNNYVETSFCRSSSLGWLVVLIMACIAAHRDFAANTPEPSANEKTRA